jgi:glutamate---cysteine ligase / carboxylate-amine ligase
MSVGEEQYTLGVEEEYQIVDPKTRELRAHGGGVLQRAQEIVDEEEGVTPELLASQVEATTPVLSTLSEVRAELLRLRCEVSTAAEEEGDRILAAGTHPFSRWQEQPISPGEHYQRVMDTHQQMAHEQLTFGFHVHVGLSDWEAAVQVMNHIRLWLATLLALSANSPFWNGADTGYASYRSRIWGRLALSGPTTPFGSRAEYDALVEALVAAGVVSDDSSIYWDVRLNEQLQTVELKVMDACSRVDEAVMLAGLVRALVRTCDEQAKREEPYPMVRPEFLHAANRRASRYGLDGDLLDVEAGTMRPAGEMIEKLLTFIRPALERDGDWEEVSSLTNETLEGGNGAKRQRETYERTGQLNDVVDTLLEETAQGRSRA